MIHVTRCNQGQAAGEHLLVELDNPTTMAPANKTAEKKKEIIVLGAGEPSSIVRTVPATDLIAWIYQV